MIGQGSIFEVSLMAIGGRGAYCWLLVGAIACHGEILPMTGEGFLSSPLSLNKESPAELVRLLASDEKEENDKGLAGLDSLGHARGTREKIHRIVNGAFHSRGLRIQLQINDLKEATRFTIRIFDGEESIGVLSGGGLKETQFISIGEMFLFKNGYRGKRIFPLLYRWMTTHPEFKGLDGYRLKVITTESGVAALQKGGFQNFKVHDIGESKTVFANFPQWGDSSHSSVTVTDLASAL